MVDAYTDLAALAANDTRHGRLWHCIEGDCWSYVSCPTAGGNRLVPAESVTNDRVQAAFAAGAWVASVVDTSVSPPRILAVQQATVSEATVKTVKTAQLTTADAVLPL